ncbi:Ribonuclease H-like superfamily [Sesbania bispinosa]|nr:Ribonuclease H-like superfamily [Sesbania bispinosa]
MYREEALRLLAMFEELEALHMPRVENKHADVLATIGSRERINEGKQVVMFKKRGSPNLALKPHGGEVEDWRRPILEKLRQRILSKVVREYRELGGTLYKKSTEGLLMRCVAEAEGVQRVDNLHHATCREEGPSLYHRMQTVGMYWPSMKAHCESIQKMCEKCRDTKEWLGINVIEEDWRRPLREYLEAGVLPLEPREAKKLKKKYERYFFKDGELFNKSFTGEALRCIENSQQEAIMAEKQGDLIHASAASKHGITSPYPFHTWVMDFVGPITSASGEKRLILAAMEHYTRWVEAIATNEAKAEVVTSFIKESIICRFGLPQCIVSDNGTHFINAKNLLRILARMVGDAPRDWATYLPLALWAYKTIKHGSTKATLFSLVYGAEAVLPAEVIIPSARMILGEGIPQEAAMEGVNEERTRVEEELMKQHRRLALAYEKLVRPIMFHEGELVLKATDAVMRKQHTSKWSPNWEGPYFVKEVYDSGYCTLLDPEDERVIGPVNFKYIKKYYA